MKFLGAESLTDALMKCFMYPGTRIIIVFSSDEHYAEFSDIILDIALKNKLDGARWCLYNKGECEGIEFCNGSIIRFVVSRCEEDKWFYKMQPPYRGYDEVIYDYDAKTYELDDYLDSFNIIT